MTEIGEISLSAAFIGGFLSFFSPCILPLLPVYVSLFSGLSTAELYSGKSKFRIFLYTVIFIAGFSTVYLALGAGSSLVGAIFMEYADYLRILGGILLILFGFLLIGLIRSGYLLREFRVSFKLKKFGTPLAAFLIGVGFAAGWSPCIGPVLGSILIYSSMGGDVISGMRMLGAYSLGIAIPFLISSLLIDTVMKTLKKYLNFFRFFNYFIGFLLIIFGLVMIFNLSPN